MSSYLFISIVKIKSKPGSSSSKTTVTTTTKVREKKVFTLPGQKYDPPEEVENIIILILCFSSEILQCYFGLIPLILSSFGALYQQREPLRIFYESLSKQIPSSEMAEFWLAFLLISLQFFLYLILLYL